MNSSMELFWRLIDAILNRLFALRPRAATFRLWSLIVLLLLSGFFISLFYYPLSVWLELIRDVFGYLLNPDYLPKYPGDPFYNLANYAWQAFTDPRVLQYLPIFLASFFIALQAAANYLADIFELDDPGVARNFVSAVALTGSSNTIRISQGHVIEDNKQSPVFLIGGPGRVMVDMDSAALFERPDGTPRVIPSAGTGTARMVTLDGFERFRQAVDLRPHVIELRDEEGRSAEIRGRSLDGIPISATDVCFQFTAFRNGLLPTTANPYPFYSNKTIEDLVYKATSTVKPELPNPSKFEPNWPGNMVSLVRSKLGGFMNEHKLTEYLASIGEPEADRLNQRADELSGAAAMLTQSTDPDTPASRRTNKPAFYPRDQLKLLLFNLYAAQFTSAQSEKGVELYWIGMGTWRVPTEIFPETGIVPTQHIEAWKVSRENIKKGSDIASGKYREEAILQKFVALIQEVPVTKPLTAATDDERENAMKALLKSYRLQLIQSAEFLKAKGARVPNVIIAAIGCLSRVLGEEGWNWTGGVDLEDNCPPAYGFDNGHDDTGPSPRGPVPPDYGTPYAGEPSASAQEVNNWQRSEEALYNELVILVHGDREVAERLIQKEQRDFPKESRRQWIIRARDRLLHDRGAFTP